MDPLVCVYVLEDSEPSRSETLVATVQASAFWSLRQRDEPTPEFSEWLESGHRKHFRRAKPLAFKNLAEGLEGTFTLSEDGANLWVSGLMRLSEIPKRLKKLQMNHFSLGPERSELNSNAPVTVETNSELLMTIGKEAVAVAHATQELVLHLAEHNPEFLDSWQSQAFKATVVSRELSALPESGVKIEDFGLTEVAAGSVTAQAWVND